MTYEPNLPRTKLAVQIAREAGKLLEAGFGSHFEIKNKEGRHNLVTEYDHKSEELIHNLIREDYPDDGILAEEGGNLTESTSGYEWVIDPLDGTVNFAHGIPMFSVSIGVRKGKEMVLGVVYHPITEELFIAEKGKGAYLNGKKLRVTNTKTLDDSIISTGFPYNLIEDPLCCIEKLTVFLRKGLPIRRIGVASLDLTYLAAGRFDGFFEASLQAWDLAAGKLMVEEAGGIVSDWNGNPLDIDSTQPILLSNGKIHEEMRAILKV